ncbi:fibronectin type III domain-containing protein [Methylobacterium sp. Leaf88]|uniref:fibronectin type III domain-containing protein n=1 Tax=Methylobacterium sp. Leaf88 TaxID=1736244 RepID=UPI000700E398|nr:fibronectin type III domain-containing protein [Methylobacterium sp. Leaf88]KQO76429.1 hypothetical protein ASF20_13865 [Methylobacterium sp. Leaf88]
MADPVTPSGAITLTLESGKALTVKAGAGANGSIAVISGKAVEIKDQIGANGTKTYGPFEATRLVRIYPQAGTFTYQVAASVSALPSLAPATISADGKTISGVGVKPTTNVLVYNVDTGVQLGQVTALADGSWSLTLNAALSSGDRIGYDPTIVGPAAVVGTIVGAPGQVANLVLGAATDTTQALTWDAPSGGGAPTGYLGEYRAVGQSAWTTFPTNGTGTSATVTGLTASTAYQYRVTATNDTGPGPASATVTGSTAAAQNPGSPDATTNFDDESNLALKSSLGV